MSVIAIFRGSRFDLTKTLGNEQSGMNLLRLVGEVRAVWSDEHSAVPNAGDLVRRRKCSTELSFSGGEVEIVNLCVDAVRVGKKNIVGIVVPVDDFLARGDTRNLAGWALPKRLQPVMSLAVGLDTEFSVK
jgi:hypothetical protein